MFEALADDLIEQIETLVKVGRLDKVVRDFVWSEIDTDGQAKLSTFETSCFDDSPNALAWRIYDHCAAITRLYSLLEIFVADVVREVCSEYPKHIPLYSDLPLRVQKSHRIGFGQLIREIEEKRYHSKLVQANVIDMYAKALANVQPYQLIPQAFLISKRALRLDQLRALWGDLGIKELDSELLNCPQIWPYVKHMDKVAKRKQALNDQLEEFIDARNIAAHEKVDDVWPRERIRDAAYFVRDVCLSLVALADQSFINHDLINGRLIKIGKITETYRHGQSAIVPVHAGSLRVNDEIIVVTGKGFKVGFVTSLQMHGHSVQEVQGSDGVELGLGASIQLHEGNVIFGRPETTSTTVVQMPFPDVEEEEATDPDVSPDLRDAFDPPSG